MVLHATSGNFTTRFHPPAGLSSPILRFSVSLFAVSLLYALRALLCALCSLGLPIKPAGLVRASHKGRTGHGRKAHAQSEVLIFGEFLGRYIPDDGVVPLRRGQILAEGEQAAPGAADILQGGEQFLPCLPSPSITPDFVTTGGVWALARARNSRDRA